MEATLPEAIQARRESLKLSYPTPEGRDTPPVCPGSYHRTWRLRNNMWPKTLNKGSFKFLKIQTSEVHYRDRTGNFSSLDIKKKSKGRYSNSFLHNNEDTDLQFRVISH